MNVLIVRFVVAFSFVLIILSLGGIWIFAQIGVIWQGDMLAFVSNRAGNTDIFVVDLRWRIDHNLTQHPAADYQPVWSPDGTMLAFVSERTGNPDVYILELGSGEFWSPVPHHLADGKPSWSPDSQRLVFESHRSQETLPIGVKVDTREVMVVYVDGSNLQNLSNDNFQDWDPHWSPDGKQIAFVSARHSQPGIFLIDVAGDQQPRYVYGGELRDYHDLRWSPDGTRLVLTSLDDIHILDLENPQLINLTADLAVNDLPEWSPDGKRIAFVTHRQDGTEVFVLDIERGQLRNLSQHFRDDNDPAWSPDGVRIALASSRNGPLNIYVFSADGETIQQVTRHNALDWNPVWRP